MVNISNKLFFCYAWEDTANVQDILNEFEYELKARVSSNLTVQSSQELTDSICRNIEESEVFVVFISEASKKSDYVKACVTRASHLNKNILPVVIEKQDLFSSMPEEFSFRSKVYSYYAQDSRMSLFAQLKASLGLQVENGDECGALIHIVTDRDARVMRFREDLGVARANSDHKIRLAKGTHPLDFIDIEDPSIKYSESYTVQDNGSEQFLQIPLAKLFREKQMREDKARREDEMKRRFDEEQSQRNQELKQQEHALTLLKQERDEKQRQIDLFRQAEERKRQEEERRRREQEHQQMKEDAKEFAGKAIETTGCIIEGLANMVLWIVGIAVVLIIIICSMI